MPVGGRKIAICIIALFSAALLIPVSVANADPVPLSPIYGTGAFGGGAGQISPAGSSIDPAGNVYVAETGYHRISAFSSQGAFLRAFGADVDPTNVSTASEVCTATCKPGNQGPGAGQLNSPTDVALDPAGDLYVADQLNNRIAVFSPGGAFLRAFGFDVVPANAETGFEVCTTTCKIGVDGGLPGQLKTPKGVDFDSNGNLYITDSGNRRISVFSAQGDFVRAFGWDVDPTIASGTGLEVCTTTTSCKPGIPGSGAGQLGAPEGISADGSSLFVAEAISHRISVYTIQGSFLRAFGRNVDPGGSSGFEVCTTICGPADPGAAAGELNDPTGVSVDSSGNLFVADYGNNRISVFTGQGSFVRAFGFDVIPANAEAGYEVCTATTTCKIGALGAGVGQLNTPYGVAIDCRGAVYVSDRGNARIQRFGESATALPPCSGPPPPPPPSNKFSFGKVKTNTRKGTATVAVELPGPGVLKLRGKQVRSQTKQITAAGKTRLSIKAKGRAKKKLVKSGKVKLRLSVSFTPTGGTSANKTKLVRLKRRR